MQGFLTTDQVAWRFGVTRVTVFRWCRRGLFPGAQRVGTGAHAPWIIPTSEVESFTPPPRGGGRPRKERKQETESWSNEAG